jgi:hypothetical protein
MNPKYPLHLNFLRQLFSFFSTSAFNQPPSSIFNMPRRKNLSTKMRRDFTFANKLDVLDMIQNGSVIPPLVCILGIDKAVVYQWQKQVDQNQITANKQGLDVNK